MRSHLPLKYKFSTHAVVIGFRRIFFTIKYCKASGNRIVDKLRSRNVRLEMKEAIESIDKDFKIIVSNYKTSEEMNDVLCNLASEEDRHPSIIQINERPLEQNELN